MKIEVKFTTRKALMLFVAGLLLVGVAVVVAFSFGPGTVPNPGHSLSQVQGYFSIDSNLQDTLGRFCQSDGTNCKPLSIDVNERSCPQNNDCPIDCDAGDLLVGGGFHNGNSIAPTWYSRPQSDVSGWECYIFGTGGRCYVTCLNIA